jgi:hypothetical protein
MFEQPNPDDEHDIQWEKSTHGQATGKLYHLRLRVECTFFVIYKTFYRNHQEHYIKLQIKIIHNQNIKQYFLE